MPMTVVEGEEARKPRTCIHLRHGVNMAHHLAQIIWLFP